VVAQIDLEIEIIFDIENDHVVAQIDLEIELIFSIENDHVVAQIDLQIELEYSRSYYTGIFRRTSSRSKSAAPRGLLVSTALVERSHGTALSGSPEFLSRHVTTVAPLVGILRTIFYIGNLF